MKVSPKLAEHVPHRVIATAIARGPGRYAHEGVVFYVVPTPSGLTAVLPSETLTPAPG